MWWSTIELAVGSETRGVTVPDGNRRALLNPKARYLYHSLRHPRADGTGGRLAASSAANSREFTVARQLTRRPDSSPLPVRRLMGLTSRVLMSSAPWCELGILTFRVVAYQLRAHRSKNRLGEAAAVHPPTSD